MLVYFVQSLTHLCIQCGIIAFMLSILSLLDVNSFQKCAMVYEMVASVHVVLPEGCIREVLLQLQC